MCKNRQQKAMFYAVLTTLCWSTVAVAFKISLSQMSYVKLLMIASVAALIVFFIDSFRKGAFRGFRVDASLLKYAALGLMNPFLYYLVLFKAYDLLPAQVAQPLNYSWQILLLLLSVPFLGAKVSGRQVLWLCVSFVGIILISMQGSITGFQIESVGGVFLALGSAFIWAFYWIFNSKVSSELDSSLRLFFNFLFGTIYLLIYASIFDDFSLPSTSGVFAALYVGLFEMGLTFIFWSKALELAVNRAAVVGVTYLSPVVSMVLIYFVLGEEFYQTTIVGFVLIICGIIFSAKSPRKIK